MALRQSDTYIYKPVDDRRIKPVPLAYGQCLVQGTIIRSSYMDAVAGVDLANPGFETGTTGWGGDVVRQRWESHSSTYGDYGCKLSFPLALGMSNTKEIWYHQDNFEEGIAYRMNIAMRYTIDVGGIGYNILMKPFFYDEIDGVGEYRYTSKLYKRRSWGVYKSSWRTISHSGSFRATSAAASRRVGIEVTVDIESGGSATINCYFDNLSMPLNEDTGGIISPNFLIAMCRGEVQALREDGIYINGTPWGSIPGAEKAADLYLGTADQEPDSRFTDDSDPQAYRGVAYAALTVPVTEDFNAGSSPRVEIEGEWKKCIPIGGGTPVFSRNPGEIMYDFYRTVKNVPAEELNAAEFQALADYCPGRYGFDYAWDDTAGIDEQEDLISKSFFGQVIRSGGLYKPVWLHGQDISYAFDDNNTREPLPKFETDAVPNVVRVLYKDEAKKYIKMSCELRDEESIARRGEVLLEEDCYYIVEADTARARVQLMYDLARLCPLKISIKAARIDASILELYDVVTYSNTALGWSAIKFYVTSKTMDDTGLCTFGLAQFDPAVMREDTPEDPRQLVWMGDPFGLPPAPTTLAVREAARETVGGVLSVDLYVTWTPAATGLPVRYMLYVIDTQTAEMVMARIVDDGQAHVTLHATGLYYLLVQTMHYYWMTDQALGETNVAAILALVEESGTTAPYTPE